MLARENRLRSADDFRNTMKLGRKAVTDHMVVYLQTVEEPRPFRLGVVVAKSTGNAVERNLIKRKFRAAIQQRIDHFDQGDNLVLRALPGIAKLDWSDFAAELDQNLKRLNRPRVS